MGTLTAGQPRLPEYCEHKLPTSCRLSSLANCCACEDERSHAAAYSVYIDGVGYVLRGSRWQRYCWFCKEFWENRVRASGLPPAHTRIPEEPNQSAFLERWYEFHQGYRTVIGLDGSEERIAVVGEDFRDVSPGMLPRTVEELRAGQQQSTFADTQAHPVEREVSTGPSLELTLDALLEEANAEEAAATPNIIHAQAMAAAGSRLARTREYQIRRIAALRRELHRMRNGIERVVSGLQELGEAVPDHSDAAHRLARLDESLGELSNIGMSEQARLAVESVNSLARDTNALNTNRVAASLQERIDDAQTAVTDARTSRDRSATELETHETALASAQRHLRNLQIEQRTNENMVRIFGTREDIIAQGDDYESPIGGMFNRAYERFRDAENIRREERTLRQYLESEQAVGGEHNMDRLAAIEAMTPDVWGVRRSQTDSDPSQGIQHAETSNTTQLMEMARDEVFAGQGSGSPTYTTDGLGESQSAADSNGTSELRQGLDSRKRDDLIHLLQNIDNSRWNRHSNGTTTASEWLDAVREETFSVQAQSDFLDLLLDDTELCWSVGLPRHRLQREFRHRRLPVFSEGARENSAEHWQDLELMAHAFLVSARVRESTALDSHHREVMFSSLQRGNRDEEVRAYLQEMLDTPATMLAAEMALAQVRGPPLTIAREIEDMDAQRQELIARTGASRVELETRRSALREHLTGLRRLRVAQVDLSEAMRSVYENRVEEEEEEDEALGLDAVNSGRPEPKSEAELTVKSNCQVCFEQLADVACLPCGHVAMCKWCSDQHSPCYKQDATRPRRPANCPICRKRIKQKVTIYRA